MPIIFTIYINLKNRGYMESAKIIASVKSGQNEDTLGAVRERKLNQLYIGVAGPTGCGASLVANTLSNIFSAKGYKVVPIKVSDLIKKTPVANFDVPEDKTVDRIIALQNKGDEIRKKSKYAIAQLICSEITKIRKKDFGDNYNDSTSDAFKKSIDQKVVFIFDSLKNPAEVELLREVYKNSFYLLGILSLESTCRSRFKSKGYDEREFHKIFWRDAEGNTPNGQQVRSVLKNADIFINNNKNQVDELKKKLERYVHLIMKNSVVTPTRDESAMHHAYVAGARSACLSRQVGAAIVTSDGHLISTGCNDVPKYGGGLYDSDDKKDQRCYNKGQLCYNDDEKNKLYKLIFEEIKPLLKEASPQSVTTALKKTRIKDLIEFSRAVHAEMDAIVGVASDSKATTKGAILYTTTFPCHNCARHIVAAGIEKVYYIEPYVKSLAPTLHDDAISLDEDVTRVNFLNYEGVAPRRYLSLFEKKGWKSAEGKLSLPDSWVPPELDRMPVDSFYDLELKVVKDLGAWANI